MLLHRTRLSEPAWGSCPRSGRDGQRTGRGTDNVRAGGRTTYGQGDGQRTDRGRTRRRTRGRTRGGQGRRTRGTDNVRAGGRTTYGQGDGQRTGSGTDKERTCNGQPQIQDFEFGVSRARLIEKSMPSCLNYQYMATYGLKCP